MEPVEFNNLLLKQINNLSLEIDKIKFILGEKMQLAFTPVIRLSGDMPARIVDTITKQRTKECVVTVTASLDYFFLSSRQQQNGTTCNTYRITITITVTQTCTPASESPVPRTTTHITEKEFCGQDKDDRLSGQTTDFDGKETDTLKYKNGTKIKVVTDKGQVTVTIEFPDGTSVSTSVS